MKDKIDSINFYGEFYTLFQLFKLPEFIAQQEKEDHKIITLYKKIKEKYEVEKKQKHEINILKIVNLFFMVYYKNLCV